MSLFICFKQEIGFQAATKDTPSKITNPQKRTRKLNKITNYPNSFFYCVRQFLMRSMASIIFSLELA